MILTGQLGTRNSQLGNIELGLGRWPEHQAIATSADSAITVALKDRAASDLTIGDEENLEP